MKRTLVMNLFHPVPEAGAKVSYGPWTTGKELPNCKAGLFQVTLEDAEVLYCYYYRDKAMGLTRPDESSLWYNAKNEQPVFNVSQWREVNHEE